MSDQPSPYTVPVELTSLSERGVEFTLLPDAAERARIAAWLDALEVPRLEGTIRLARIGDDDYYYDAEFTAEVVQACVVTLEPVHAVHTGTASRRYRVTARPSRRAARVAQVKDPVDDNDAELLTGSVLDIAAPVLEELSLMLDPYPRAPGVTFEPPKDEAKTADSPFAALAKLKVSQPKKSGPRG